MLPEDLLLRKVLFLKVCELLENTFPNLREGDRDELYHILKYTIDFGHRDILIR